ncbi:esterase/lipase family protein [Pontivivens nitratireducens]|uniref:Alpha/beta hydrolase n=1 Tax=Pontivivens nitratireducens TaxID=2758038 RepID=A0A6G7VPD4_9RHOB|nr:alpha/beta hydrolase [Pontibrevibacter nitratireducens]QIK41943.1 alpha/beta hydrolase [Pontibrevibacter nitratireducens]
MKRILALLLMLPSAAFADCVVLLHGLARTDASLLVMETVLRREGFDVVNHTYPSTEATIPELAEIAVPEGLSGCKGTRPVHFVTHSMGGIVLRQYLSEMWIDGLGRVVMLAPPNQGAELAERLGDLPIFEWMNGAAGLQLGTGRGSVPLGLGPVTFDLGVIAGNQTVNIVTSALIEGADDGKVSVTETQVEGMDDMIVLPVTHTFMMNDPVVIAEVLAFLRTGQFERDMGLGGALEEIVTVTGQ